MDGSPHLKGMSVLGLVDGSQHGLVDPEAHGGGDQGEGEVTDHTAMITMMTMMTMRRKRICVRTDLMREMYLTARRQTRTEPQMMPESLGWSQ